MAIHCLPYGFMPPTPEDLLPVISDSIRNAIGVGLFSVRFLQSDPAKSVTKGSGSVVLSLPPLMLLPLVLQSDLSPTQDKLSAPTLRAQ